jgi:F-type H+-transporting ATPase subunit alpha
VSRVGGDAQTKATRAAARGLRLDLQQYREIAAFAGLGGSDLDKVTLQQLRRGERLQELLKQPQYSPIPVEKQVIFIYAGTRGYLDEVPKEKVGDFERDLYRALDTQYRTLADTIKREKAWNPEIEKLVKAMLDEFKKTHTYGEKPAAGEKPADGGKPAAPAAAAGPATAGQKQPKAKEAAKA